MTTESSADWVSASCSLPTVEQPLRVAEFDRLFGESMLRYKRASTTRLIVVLEPDAEAAARNLAERESGCCSFFDFHFHGSGSEVSMSVGVPASHADVLDALTRRVSVLAEQRR